MQINSGYSLNADYTRVNGVSPDQKKVNEDENSGTGTQEQPVSKTEDAVLISKLQSSDTKVRAHEAAHIAAGGGVVTGGANFSYTRGPDGRMYATGGEVPIDTSRESTPEGTIQKARQISAAAMAPADPSPTDYRVAASAVVMEMRARMELVREQMERLNGEKTYGSLGSVVSSSTEEGDGDIKQGINAEQAA